MTFKIDTDRVQTPAYVIDLGCLERNLRILDEVQQEAGCTILLALKGFAAWSTFPLIRKYLTGIAASSVGEARLGREEFGGVVHTYAPAYSFEEFDRLVRLSDHLVFNSGTQLERFADQVRANRSRVHFGLRVNPEHSEVKTALYDPCAPRSRLGATAESLRHVSPDVLGLLTGVHFHTLCELGADALQRTLPAVEKNFAPLLEQASWVNFGGGHHITQPGYDAALLIRLVREFSARWNVKVFLEPGEAIAIHTGVLVASVVDVTDNGGPIAILDISATAHMPDVLEMPYRPKITGGSDPGQLPYTYRLGGTTCLAGDVIGDYSFAHPLDVGDKLIFEDMSHYTMVKTTTFNGVRHPSIALHDSRDQSYRVVREFGYEDYRDRLS